MPGYVYKGATKHGTRQAQQPKPKRGRPLTQRTCGTPSAYALHRYHGEPIDELCRQANIKACREYRARLKAAA